MNTITDLKFKEVDVACTVGSEPHETIKMDIYE